MSEYTHEPWVCGDSSLSAILACLLFVIDYQRFLENGVFLIRFCLVFIRKSWVYFGNGIAFSRKSTTFASRSDRDSHKQGEKALNRCGI
jgi:hypothetical protein